MQHCGGSKSKFKIKGEWEAVKVSIDLSKCR